GRTAPGRGSTRSSSRGARRSSAAIWGLSTASRSPSRAARRSSGRSGSRSARFPPASRGAMRSWPVASAVPPQSAPSAPPTAPIRFRLSCPATASSARTDRSSATAAGWIASGGCSRTRASRRGRCGARVARRRTACSSRPDRRGLRALRSLRAARASAATGADGAPDREAAAAAPGCPVPRGRSPRRRRIALLLVFLIASAPAPRAQTPSERPVPYFDDPSRPERLAAAYDTIRAAMPDLAREIGAPAVVWGVVVDGTLAASGAYGLRDVEANAPATLDTVFRIASMTKSFTALAILKLRDEGRLSLDDPVVKHVPEFASVALPTRDSAPITIRQLLTHGAGFAEDNAWGDRQLAQPDATLNEWLALGLPFSTAPGTAYEYSNYGFALLGRIVANVSRRPYAEYMNTQILQPLGMTASY